MHLERGREREIKYEQVLIKLDTVCAVHRHSLPTDKCISSNVQNHEAGVEFQHFNKMPRSIRGHPTRLQI